MINRKILIGLSISLAITLPIIGLAKFHGGKVSNPKAGRLFQQEIEQIKELYDLRGVYNEMKATANDITDVKGFWKDFSGNITSAINNKYKQGIFAESNQKKKILELTTNIEWMSKNELANLKYIIYYVLRFMDYCIFLFNIILLFVRNSICRFFNYSTANSHDVQIVWITNITSDCYWYDM